MIKQVARALHDEWNGVGGWSSLTDAEIKRWEFMARAAIEAMMEPTQAMYVAGLDVTVASCAYDAADEREVYQAMITAALEELK